MTRFGQGGRLPRSELTHLKVGPAVCESQADHLQKLRDAMGRVSFASTTMDEVADLARIHLLIDLGAGRDPEERDALGFDLLQQVGGGALEGGFQTERCQDVGRIGVGDVELREVLYPGIGQGYAGGKVYRDEGGGHEARYGGCARSVVSTQLRVHGGPSCSSR